MSEIKLTPAFVIYMNGTRFSADQESSVQEITVMDRIDAPSVFSIRMSNKGGKWTDLADFAEGTKMKIMLGYKDAVETVIEAEITGINPGFRMNASDQLILNGSDGRHKLLRGITTRSFSKMTDAGIIKQIATDCGLQCETDEFGINHDFVMQNAVSDYDYVMRLARTNNCRVSFADGKLVVKKVQANEGGSEITEWGKTLLEFEVKMTTKGLSTEMEVRGWDRKNKKPVTGTAKSPDVTAKVGGDKLGLEKIKKAYGDYKSVVTDSAVCDQKSADALALNLLSEVSMEYITAGGKCQGNCKLKSGSIIEVKEVGNKYSGKYMIYEAQHRFSSTGGYYTFFQLKRNSEG